MHWPHTPHIPHYSRSAPPGAYVNICERQSRAYAVCWRSETIGRAPGTSGGGAAEVRRPGGLGVPLESFLALISTGVVAEMGNRTPLLKPVLSAQY